MSSEYLALTELLLVFGCALLFGALQLRSLRKPKRPLGRQDRSDDPSP